MSRDDKLTKERSRDINRGVSQAKARPRDTRGVTISKTMCYQCKIRNGSPFWSYQGWFKDQLYSSRKRMYCGFQCYIAGQYWVFVIISAILVLFTFLSLLAPVFATGIFFTGLSGRLIVITVMVLFLTLLGKQRRDEVLLMDEGEISDELRSQENSRLKSKATDRSSLSLDERYRVANLEKEDDTPILDDKPSELHRKEVNK